MPVTIDEILRDDLIEVVDRDDELGSYAIKLGSLQTVVSIELGRFRSSDQTKYNVSHAIKTPTQIGAYRTSRPLADSWELALSRAISGLTMYYREATRAGHEPSEDWLERY
jgi:hypothetical protein